VGLRFVRKDAYVRSTGDVRFEGASPDHDFRTYAHDAAVIQRHIALRKGVANLQRVRRDHNKYQHVLLNDVGDVTEMFNKNILAG
jgi:hypothetical protein